jgi:hypothetical protein
VCEHLQRVQKSRDQVNLHLNHVISDLTGEPGLAILDAILKGKRDGAVLARLRNDRCKAGEATIAKALRGDWRGEHLFTLRQSLAAWRYHPTLVTECEAETTRQLAALTTQSAAEPPKRTKNGTPSPTHRCAVSCSRSSPSAEVRSDGASLQPPAHLPERSRDRRGQIRHAGARRLVAGLCPENRSSGGRKLGTATRPGLQSAGDRAADGRAVALPGTEPCWETGSAAYGSSSARRAQSPLPRTSSSGCSGPWSSTAARSTPRASVIPTNNGCAVSTRCASKPRRSASRFKLSNHGCPNFAWKNCTGRPRAARGRAVAKLGFREPRAVGLGVI